MNRISKSQLHSMTDEDLCELFDAHSDIDFDTDEEDDFDDETDDLAIVLGKNLLVGDENVSNLSITINEETQFAVGQASGNDLSAEQCMEIDTDSQASSCETLGFSEFFWMTKHKMKIIMLIVHCLFYTAQDDYFASVENLVNVRNNIGIFVGESNEINPESNEFKNISWEQSNLQCHTNEFKFRESETLPCEISSLRTPYDFFSYFVTDAFLDEVVDQTNLYANQINPKANFEVSVIEMKKYIGILIFMSVFKYPNVRSYWGRYGFDPIRSTMTVNRFEEIRRYIHFADASKMPSKDDPEYDVLFKMRPVINHFNDRFSSVPMTQRLCVDEQMCPTKMNATNIKQYMPKKPHKWGFKLFVLCSSSGFAHAFEVYAGAKDNKLNPNIPNLGAAANVVARLPQKIPDNANHILYFDNFFTTLPLLVYLRSRGIYSLGTIRYNRIPNTKLSCDAKVKKMDRGQTEEFVGVAYGCNISSVLWNDMRAVRLVSTYVGTLPFYDTVDRRRKPQQIERWDKVKKQKVFIDCPMIISEYNKQWCRLDGFVDWSLSH